MPHLSARRFSFLTFSLVITACGDAAPPEPVAPSDDTSLTDPGGAHPAVALGAADCGSAVGCCADPLTCIVTDKQTLASITYDETLACRFELGQHVAGAGLTGVAPAGFPANRCGLSYAGSSAGPADAMNALDHTWLQGIAEPIVMDLGTARRTVVVFPSVDHLPFPEEGIEVTVWGSNSPDASAFPAGWAPASLTAIWGRGWEEPAACEPGDNSDDFLGQYSFATPFRYVAVYANLSMTIFDDPAHTSWQTFGDSAPDMPGWQSDDDEIDAVGSVVCEAGDATADAGPDQIGNLGESVCFTGTGSARAGSAQLAWDTDGDGAPDTAGPTACVTCQAGGGDVTLTASDRCTCSAIDTARYACNACPEPSATVEVGHPGCAAHPEVEVELTATATDADGDGDALTYAWLIDGTIARDGASVSATVLPGDHTAVVTVSDGHCTRTQAVTFTALAPTP